MEISNNAHRRRKEVLSILNLTSSMVQEKAIVKLCIMFGTNLFSFRTHSPFFEPEYLHTTTNEVQAFRSAVT